MKDFSAIQIFREINFGHLLAPRTAILTIWEAQNYVFLGTFDISSVKFLQKSKFQSFKIVKIAVFDLLKSAKIDFT